MENEQPGGMRRRSEQQPRTQAVTVKLSADERTAIQLGADRRHLSLGAFIAETALAAAANQTVPVTDLERQVLGELVRIHGLLYACRTRLAETADRMEASGTSGPDLETVAAHCSQACDETEVIMLKLSRMLLHWRRRLRSLR